MCSTINVRSSLRPFPKRRPMTWIIVLWRLHSVRTIFSPMVCIRFLSMPSTIASVSDICIMTRTAVRAWSTTKVRPSNPHSFRVSYAIKTIRSDTRQRLAVYLHCLMRRNWPAVWSISVRNWSLPIIWLPTRQTLPRSLLMYKMNGNRLIGSIWQPVSVWYTIRSSVHEWRLRYPYSPSMGRWTSALRMLTAIRLPRWKSFLHGTNSPLWVRTISISAMRILSHRCRIIMLWAWSTIKALFRSVQRFMTMNFAIWSPLLIYRPHPSTKLRESRKPSSMPT